MRSSTRHRRFRVQMRGIRTTRRFYSINGTTNRLIHARQSPWLRVNIGPRNRARLMIFRGGKA